MAIEKFNNLLKDPNTNWKYIIIVAILTFLVGGGILYWLPKQETEMPEIEIPEREAPEEVEVPADWKTYRNEYSYGKDYWGYEIQYPSDWTMRENKGVYEARWTSPRRLELPLVEIRIKTGHTVRDSSVYIDYAKCDWSEAQKEWFEKIGAPESKGYPAPVGKEQIGETEFCRLEDVGGDESGQIGGLIVEYAVVKNEWRYEHSLTVLYDRSGGYYPSEKDYSYELNVFKQMLSTFRFLE